MIFVTIGAWFALAGLLTVIVRGKHAAVNLPLWKPVWSDALPALGLALAVSACYGWMARSYFLSDDFVLLAQAHDFSGWRTVFSLGGGDGFFRPLGYISYAITARWADWNPGAWHWIGFLIHILNSLLLYFLAAALGYSRFPAALAATLFAVHGAHPEAALWMAGRFDLLATFFVLAALLAFLRSLLPGIHRPLWVGAAFVAMSAGLLSKESGYSFVLLAALILICTGAARDRRAWLSVLFFSVVTLVAFSYRWHLLRGIGGYGSISLFPSIKALAFRIWGLLFFPVNWTLPSSFWLIAALVTYCIALAKMFLVRTELGLVIFAIGFVFLSALPAVSQLLIGADLEKSRVLYLPSAGFCLCLAALARALPLRSRVAVAAVVLGFQVVALEHNLGGWRSASETVRAACATAAQCAIGKGARPVVSGLPRTLHGVYVFANGFPECVAMQTRAAQLPAPATHACNFTWDAATASLKPEQ